MFENAWTPYLKKEFAEPYFQDLSAFLREEYAHKTIYPRREDVFNAFQVPDMPNIKAVILGQDPYYREGQACGFCFAVRKGVEIPPSLKNIYQEIHDDLGLPIPATGYLLPWARQGVVLLNTVMTVESGKPLSHRNHGWEIFTDRMIRKINELDQPIVFLLWGRPAREKKKLLDNPRHLVLEAAHPSPLSAYNGFFGCRHFSKTNEFLVRNGVTPIDWRI
ncbi:MAG: uracil-DNA glycosylase [Erysipelotrichales bacterium]|nr:uracil-DNA glycosylase [Erysipelotrichales bacterium]MBQ2479585.1 uracil-DNA glycosylase [Erysipelotrichales bacterium]MBQ4375038.1 uracil-DNA glycosylase [Erysipelotrichales bacterium]